MKKFIFKFLIFISLILLSIVLIIYSTSPLKETNDYMEAIVDKHRMLENIKSPRIIFVGGSNLAFGIDSKQIEAQTGLPVVNMGLHAGLGLEFMINEIKSEIRKGDIIFLSFEYYLKRPYLDLAKHTVKIYPKANLFLPSKTFKETIDYEITDELLRYVTHAQAIISDKNFNEINNLESSVYKRKGFSRNGDLISHLSDKPIIKLKDRVKLKEIDYFEYIKKINDFSSFVKSKGGSVFYLFPNYAESEFRNNESAILGLESQLRKSLIIPIINKPQTFVFPDSCFFDTVYHLNKQGREKRTQILINIISPYLASRKKYL